jgi:hypothetical protein
VSELEAKVAQLVDIPLEDLIIMLRREQSYSNTISTELYNMEWRRDKYVSEVSKFEHGMILFCEAGKQDQPFDTFNWKREFTAESEKISISINNVMEDPDAISHPIKI